jgi:hypothetical protein
LNWTIENLNKLSDNIAVVKTDTQQCIDLPLLEATKADLIHIDGDHSIAGCIHDCELALKALSEKGIILVDDVDYCNLFKPLNIWVGTRNLFMEYIPTLRGMLIVSR